MTQEEKDLVVKDLCARLPYGVKCDYKGSVLEIDKLDVTNEEVCGNLIAWYDAWSVKNCKPYLRPMSSMTEEEGEEYNGLLYGVCDFTQDSSRLTPVIKFITFLYSHHFDCCGLIEKGLALEAPEDMYKID